MARSTKESEAAILEAMCKDFKPCQFQPFDRSQDLPQMDSLRAFVTFAMDRV